jgi:hypothetical protein
LARVGERVDPRPTRTDLRLIENIPHNSLQTEKVAGASPDASDATD